MARLFGVRRLWNWDHTGSLQQGRHSLQSQAQVEVGRDHPTELVCTVQTHNGKKKKMLSAVSKLQETAGFLISQIFIGGMCDTQHNGTVVLQRCPGLQILSLDLFVWYLNKCHIIMNFIGLVKIIPTNNDTHHNCDIDIM